MISFRLLAMAVLGLVVFSCVQPRGHLGEECLDPGQRNICLDELVCDVATMTCRPCPGRVEYDPRTGQGMCKVADVVDAPDDCGFATLGSAAVDLPENVMCRVAIPDESEINVGGYFFMDRYEVTNRLYLEYISQLPDDEARSAVPVCDSGDPSPWIGPQGWSDGRAVPGDFSEHPVGCVTQQQARDFCRWMGKKLPDRAHWFAAAGPRIFPWGNDWDQLPAGDEDDGTRSDVNCKDAPVIGESAGYCRDGSDGFVDTIHTLSVFIRTHLQRPFNETESHINQMSGNVAEWVLFPAEDGGAGICGGSFDDINTAANNELSPKSCEIVEDAGTDISISLTMGFRCAWY